MYIAQINVFFFITLIVNVYILKETKLWIANILYLFYQGNKSEMHGLVVRIQNILVYDQSNKLLYFLIDMLLKWYYFMYGLIMNCCAFQKGQNKFTLMHIIC